MQFRIFTIPIVDGERLIEEMNAFLRGKKVLKTKTRLIGRRDANGACWSFAVTYVDDIAAAERERGKIDYREVLDPPTFARFAAMREIRKQVAAEEKTPPYNVFTDYELSEIAKLETITLEAMRAIKGIGEKKVEKYGKHFLPETADAKAQ